MVKIKLKKVDVITLYRNAEGEIRWTRTNGYNKKIVGASTQGYNSKRSAMSNINRTQKMPYILKDEL